MTEALLFVADADRVRTLTLNRVAKRNAFNGALAQALGDALRAADQDPSVDVIIVSAAGDVFSAGADVSLFLAIAQGDTQSAKPVSALPWILASVAKPTLAAVQGPAVGMGVTMLPHFDVAYAADCASFTLPFVRLGLVQEFGSSWTLPRLMGPQRAAEFILRAAPLDAATAAEWGLVARVFPRAELAARVHEIARDIAMAPAGALAQAKALLRREYASADDARAVEDEVLATRYGSPENVAAVMAFLTRKK